MQGYSVALAQLFNALHMKKHYILFLFALLAGLTVKAQGLVINEVDYDQPAVDSAEFIELYNSGTSPVTLSDYTLLLVNCNNNTPYATIALPAQTLAPGGFFVLCAGFGYVANCNQNFAHTYQSGFIQNGSPDAIALLENATQNYIDAVSYEGTCAPPNGSGNGVPLAESDTVIAQDTINGIPQAPLKTYGISRYPDGADSNDDSTDFRRACITPGAANTNQNSNCGSPTGLNTPVRSTLGVSAYPNPSRGNLFIDFRGRQISNGNVSVIDVLGNEVKSFRLRQAGTGFTIELGDLQNGVYFLKAVTDQGTAMQRVVLKK